MNRVQHVFIAIATAVVLLAMPVVHVLALLHVLPGGDYRADCEETKSPGVRS